MRLMVTGAAGMLGTDLVRLAVERGHGVAAYGRLRLDLGDARAVGEAAERERPDALVNCAAFTDVDGAEAREAEAMRVNGLGAGHAAAAAAAVGARFLHLSSDYVFPGDDPRPRREDDPVGPGSAYARSKLAGERAVAAAGGRSLVVRSAWLYGRYGRNFVDTIRRKAEAGAGPLRVVDDQVGSPTWSVSLAHGLLDLLEVEAEGLVHLANRGAVSWLDLARAVVEELGLGVEVLPIRSAELGRPAARPAYSALDTGRFEKLTGRAPLAWREALKLHLKGAFDEPEPRG